MILTMSTLTVRYTARTNTTITTTATHSNNNMNSNTMKGRISLGLSALSTFQSTVDYNSVTIGDSSKPYHTEYEEDRVDDNLPHHHVLLALVLISDHLAPPGPVVVPRGALLGYTHVSCNLRHI